MSRFDVEAFFGRKDTMSLLKKRVVDLKDGYRQNIAFTGNPYLGKSFILQKFVADLDDPAIIPVYLDLEQKDLDQICFQFTGHLLYHFSRVKGLPLHQDMNLLLEGVKPLIPLTVKAIKKVHSALSNQRYQEAYCDLFSLPQIFAKESDLYCLIILDEFQDLDDLGIDEVFIELGKCIMTQKRSLYVVTSSYPAQAGQILSERLSLLFGNFEVVAVEPFSSKESREYIRFLLKDINMGEELQNFLIDFTGGHPLYLYLIGQELVTLSKLFAQPEIYIPLLIQAVENIFFDRWGALNRHFELTFSALCDGKGNRVCPSILMFLSKEKQRLKEIAEGLSLKQRVVSPKLNRLVELGCVSRNGKFFYVKDKLLGYWLKFILQRKYRAFDYDILRQKAAFKEDFTKTVNNFIRFSRRDLSAIIIELLYCFEDEAVKIHDRRYRLPLFQNITSVSAHQEQGKHFDLIKASAQDGDWCIVVGHDVITEQDLAVILKETKKVVSKPQRRVLVSCGPMDENARLKALQESMWIWDEQELNYLLSFYNKPFVVPSGAKAE